jgi:hypothetical protein
VAKFGPLNFFLFSLIPYKLKRLEKKKKKKKKKKKEKSKKEKERRNF